MTHPGINMDNTNDGRMIRGMANMINGILIRVLAGIVEDGVASGIRNMSMAPTLALPLQRRVGVLTTGATNPRRSTSDGFWGNNPWNRDDQYEERNAKRKERYDAEGWNERSEFRDFIRGADEDEDGEERLRRAKPSRPAASDIRKEYTPTTYGDRWTPTLRENTAASSSTSWVLRSRSRSPPSQPRGIS